MTGQDARLNITSREITIFFSDIASFTTICESLRSKELYLWLSSYFEEMSKIIVDRSVGLVFVREIFLSRVREGDENH